VRYVISVTDFLERTIGGVTVRIDRTTCIGTANCAKVAPDVFELDDERIVTFRDAPAASTIDRATLVDACDVCPVDALSVFDEDGRQLVP
jgi:ferredoxin